MRHESSHCYVVLENLPIVFVDGSNMKNDAPKSRRPPKIPRPLRSSYTSRSAVSSSELADVASLTSTETYATGERIPWASAARFMFLEETVFWTGTVNRSDLVNQFGISEQQASGDFTRYQELAPDNLEYDKSAKAYRAALTFEPKFFVVEPAQILSQLRLVAEGVTGDHPIIGQLALGIAATPARPVDADTLRTVVRAIRERRQMSAHYVSFSQTDGRMRRLEPHALAYDGFRWHARARDADDGAFKDYVLGRLSKADLLGPSERPPEEDVDWAAMTVLVIAANPGLSPAQKKVIERDYGMRGGTAELKVRRALAYYTKHRLGLDLDAKARRAEDQHVVLLKES